MKFLGKTLNLKASDQEIRRTFKVPENRYFTLTVWPHYVAGNVFLDESRTRPRESVKISKSDS